MERDPGAETSYSSRDAEPLVSVVIPCRNEESHIEECLLSILEMEPPDGGYEVIVAEGMSTDKTADIVSQVQATEPRLRIVSNPGRITAAGMNTGIQFARGRYVAIMGAHSKYAPDYLVRCLELSRQLDADDVGGPAVAATPTSYMQAAIAAAHNSAFAAGGAKSHSLDYEGQVDTVWGGFYKREVFDRIGLFDEALVRNQDDELNLRLSRSGGLIWQSPSVRHWYAPRRSLRALFRQYVQYGYWKVAVIRKHRLPASWRHLVPATFVSTVGLFAIAGLIGLLSLTLPAAGQIHGIGWPLIGAFLAVLAAYLCGVLAASVTTAARRGIHLLPVLPLVFACYHIAYGLGFLVGLRDFGLRNRKPSVGMAQLTR